MSSRRDYRHFPLSLRSYMVARDGINAIAGTLNAVGCGVSLGLLNRDELDRVDEFYYNTVEQYCDDDYNRSGLWGWEQRAFAQFFAKCRRMIVVSAGGGREVLALLKQGIIAHGFECNAKLVANANRLLVAEGFSEGVHQCARGTWPNIVGDESSPYDGAILGWGAYSLIQGRAHRIALLRDAHRQLKNGDPLLLSFLHRNGRERRFRVTTQIGNAFRRLRRVDLLDEGDDLRPNFIHYFTEHELHDELEQGGFRLVHFSSIGYGHAVGLVDQ